MEPPDFIANVPLWEEHCRKIHARARDLIEGRLGVIETARSLRPLAIWTHAEADADLLVFQAIESETAHLPAGSEREYWAAHALEREGAAIRIAEDRWRPDALEAAARLVEKYRWALEARRRRRESGHVG